MAEPAPGSVVSIISGRLPAERVQGLVAAYRAALAAGIPSGILATYAVDAGGGEVRIMTVWRSRADLEAMIATGEEPVARRLIREAGGEPRAEFLDVLASG